MRPKLLLILAAFALTLVTTIDTNADSLHLFSAADYGVLYMGTSTGNNIDMSNPQGGVTGNVGLYNGNLNNSDVTITGRVDFLQSTGTDGHPDPLGGSFHNVSAVGTARSDALAATAYWKNQGTGIAGASILSTTVINSSGAITVIDVNDLNLGNGESLTLNGAAGSVFVINVYGDLILNSGDLLVSGGLNINDVLYNVIGTGADVHTAGGGNASVIFGTVLATERKISLAPGLVNGRLIAGDNISIVSGADVNTPPNQVPEPASMVLLGIGLVATAGAIRRHRKSTTHSPEA